MFRHFHARSDIGGFFKFSVVFERENAIFRPVIALVAGIPSGEDDFA
jgi:hypothetical protein